MVTRRPFSREFKIEAVKLVTERSVSASLAAKDRDVLENVLRKWVREQRRDPQHAFPGNGQMKPELAEITRLKKENAKFRMERDILNKSRGLLRERIDVKFGFIAKYRGIWAVAILSGALGVSRSGFYAWRGRPPS